MRRLLLTSHQSPGDILMMTAAVRDLHAAAPGEFVTAVRTTAQDLWKNNPHITALNESDETVQRIEMQYPLIHHSNQRPYHFLHGYTQFLEQRLNRSIPVTRFQGDIHLSADEKASPFDGQLRVVPERFWILIAGGKYDFTAKWWNPDSYQAVVDHFRGKISFVQCGESGHWHPPLKGVANLVGQTGIRDFIRLMHRADGVVCPVTFAMHLAAAVESAPGRPHPRPCVVVAGGREPPHWEAYPHHQYISMVGTLDCCADGGCWRSRCQPVGDGDAKDRHNLCESPVQVSETLRIPKCMEMIRPEEVIRRIELYYEGGILGTNGSARPKNAGLSPRPASLNRTRTESIPSLPKPVTVHRLSFLRDLDALLQFRIVLRHLKHYQPSARTEIQVLEGLGQFVRDLCDFVREVPLCTDGLDGFRTVAWNRCESLQLSWASTPAMSCLTDEFRLAPVGDLCGYSLGPIDSPGEDWNQLLDALGVSKSDGSPPSVLIDVEVNADDTWQQLSETIRQRGWNPIRMSQSDHRFAVELSSWKQPALREVRALELAALVDSVNLVVGPARTATRLAAAMRKPALCLSHQLHPVWTFDPGGSVHHLITRPVADSLEAEQPTRVFRNNYSHTVLEPERQSLSEIVNHRLERHANPSRGRSPGEPPVRRARTSKSTIRFHHGLGDCAHFAHLIPLYVKRGYDIEVECTPDKRIIFEAAGATVTDIPAPEVHAWGYPSGGTHEGQGLFHQGSKVGNNISEAPLPDIGDKGQLWDELCQSRVDVRPFLSDADRSTAHRWLEGLTQPVVLFHQKGNTAQVRKSLPDAVAEEFYRAFIDQCDGTLVLLDWDQRVPRLASHRVRHLSDLGSCSLPTLLALMTQADLMIGVDSGPLHLTRFTNIPTLGIWQPGHYPSTYTMPRPEQLNLVLSGVTKQWNKFKRIPWNIVEHSGASFSGVELAGWVSKMLSPARYLRVSRDRNLPLSSSPTIAQDVQLQQFVREFCRSNGTSSLAGHWDRQRSLDVSFREASRRFQAPRVVETGTIRAEEDFGGAGFFTYLAGAFVNRNGGWLDSVDLSERSVSFAREWTSVFGEHVRIHQSDSVSFLRERSSPIDLLYLDSLDTTEPRHADHCLEEIKAAAPRLHDRSLVVIDDTPWQAGAWIGKGATAVPWLLEQGWRILYAGYQVVLSRAE